MENMKLWNKVCVTDPDVTKKVTYGRQFTAICAHSQIKTATELWGPMGGNWGVINETFAKVEGTTIMIYTAILFHPVEGKEAPAQVRIHSDIECISSGGKSSGKYNEDFTKKVATDALTKGLSKLGFNADVFEGKFDDQKYVDDLKDKKEAEKNPEREAILKIIGEIGNLMKSTTEESKEVAREEMRECKSLADYEGFKERWEAKITEETLH